jgi:hypothetical protein
MRLIAEMKMPILALPGILGCMSAVILAILALLYNFPSLGRQDVYGYIISAAAGSFIYILLGLAGALGAVLGIEAWRMARGLSILGCLLVLPCIAALAFFKEWVACVLVIIIAIVSWGAFLYKKGAALLLFTGLAGFPIGQIAMNFVTFGWKTWAIPGVLFIFCSLLFAAKSDLHSLPLLNSDSRSTKRLGYLIYPLVSLALILIAMSALIYVPAQSGLSMQNSKTLVAGTNDIQAGSWAFSSTNNKISGLSDCDCDNKDLANKTSANKALANASKDHPECEDGQIRALILSPGDIRTFPYGEPIQFEASACARGPLRYLWISSLDGVIGSREKFEASNLSRGWHNITLIIKDSSNASASDSIEIGIADPSVCGSVTPRPKYYPLDTPCQTIWPNGSRNCQEFEVCHPDLDYIVEDAINCCDKTPTSGSACAFACNNSGGDKKRCRGLYIIKAFGPEAKYMQGYSLFKACCSGYPECTRTCGINLSGTCAFREGFNGNVQNLSCQPEMWGVSAWRSDENISENSAVLGLFPTHATVNIIQTGVCIDYAAAVMTLLRKAGYNRTDVFVTASTSYELPVLGNHPGHAYNLVLLPGDSKYHFVDTTGNGDGIEIGSVPSYFWFTCCFWGMPVNIRVFNWSVGYGSNVMNLSYNDAGYFETPDRSRIYGS